MASSLAKAIMPDANSRLPLMEVTGDTVAPIAYALRCACRDPQLELERAFECDVTPSLVRDFGRKQMSDGNKRIKVVNGYVLASEFRSRLDTIASKGFKPRDTVKIHVGNIAQLVKQDAMNTPVKIEEEDIADDECTPVSSVVGASSTASSAKIPGLPSSSSSSSTAGVSAPKIPREERNAAEYLPRALLRCKLLVRKPFVTYDESYFLCNQIPDEYDSMVLLQKNSPQDFRATYVIRDHTQIVPEYYLEFGLNPKTMIGGDGAGGGVDEEDIDKPVTWCGSCKGDNKRPAEFCIEEDGWAFCKACLDDLFDKLPMMKEQRTVVPLSDMKPTFAHCALHNERKAEWWCLDCKKALCVACKVSGSHSKGRAATHTLTHIRERYEQVRKEMMKMPEYVDDATDNLKLQMSKIDERSAEVESNIEELLESAAKRARELELQIKVLGAKKLDSLRSRKHLAERNLRQIEWARKFADYITDHKIMPAETFLKSAPYHEKLIESLVENVVAVDEEQYLEKADLQLEGHLSVLIETVEKSPSPQQRFRVGMMKKSSRSGKMSTRNSGESHQPLLGSNSSSSATAADVLAASAKKLAEEQEKEDAVSSSSSNGAAPAGAGGAPTSSTVSKFAQKIKANKVLSAASRGSPFKGTEGMPPMPK
ncbi:unnamed protein product [Amoebophrya sp. A120]|nr:unnamed protein product [Amoebophrya sp. A120]|eukprot:GSA120T00010483001.1